MSSEYGKDQHKLRLFTAIKMRDAKVERLNRKTGQIEVLPYSRQYIKQVTGIKAYEAIHLGIFTRPKSKLDEMKELVAQAIKRKGYSPSQLANNHKGYVKEKG